MSIFSERLKKTRKQSGLRQEYVASELNIAYSTYRRYEQGGNDPYVDTAAKIAKYFHVSLDYLAGLTDDPTPPQKETIQQEESQAQ